MGSVHGLQVIGLPALTDVAKFCVAVNDCCWTDVITHQSLDLIYLVCRLERPNIGEFQNLLERQMTKKGQWKPNMATQEGGSRNVENIIVPTYLQMSYHV